MDPPIGNRPLTRKEEEAGDVREVIPRDIDKAVVERIKPSAKNALIHDFIMRKKYEYLDHVGERGLKLSGGEKQRLSIARAMLKRAKIICFDEATSALDNETEKYVQEAIDNVCRLGYDFED